MIIDVVTHDQENVYLHQHVGDIEVVLSWADIRRVNLLGLLKKVDEDLK